jgi:hypothetical protein
MGDSPDWQNIKYQTVLEDELRFLQRRREHDHGFTVEELKRTLAHLYIMDGADWGGRGEVQDIALKARIAAYEQFIAAWRQ